MNQRFKYLRQRSYRSNVIVRTGRHTQRTDALPGPQYGRY